MCKINLSEQNILSYKYNGLNFSKQEFNSALSANFVSTNLKTSVLLISLAFENRVGHCACVSTHFLLKSMRVRGHTENAMFKRK